MNTVNDNPQLDIEVFERAVYQQKTKNLFYLFNNALTALTSFIQKGSLTERGLRPHSIDAFYTRFAAAVTAWLSRPGIVFSAAQFNYLCENKQTLHHVFAASGYRGSGHMLHLLGDRSPGATRSYDLNVLPVLFLMLSLDETPSELLESALKLPPDQLLPLMIAWLCQRAVLTERGENNRSRLLESGHLIENAGIDAQHITPLMAAWMYSSYASAPHKHRIKRSFNQLFTRFLENDGITPGAVPAHDPGKKHPTLLVIHERFKSAHAMFRCYAPQIRGLARHFRLISLSPENQIDSAADALFEKVITFDLPKTSLNGVIKIIEDIRPDAIYFPSVGMSQYTTFLTNLRLAPVQFASQGHPATTMSDAIDYMFTGSPFIADMVDLYSETLVQHGGSLRGYHDAHPELPDSLPEKTKENDGFFHIAVNSKVMKLSYRLMNVCKRLNRDSQKPLLFHFFPGEWGLKLDGIRPLINAQLPNARVYPYLAYPDFLQAIRNCDLSLAAFPFGSSNSTVDSCLLHVPTVAHFGLEAHSQSDFNTIRRAGLPEWLVNDSDEGYFQTALRLIHDDPARLSIVSHLQQSDPREKLLSTPRNQSSELIAEAFIYAYRNHERIKKEKPPFVKASANEQ